MEIDLPLVIAVLTLGAVTAAASYLFIWFVLREKNG